MMKFIQVIRDVQVTTVNPSFVKSNKITRAKYDYALLKALRFLGIVERDGKPTERIAWLRLTGQQYTNSLEKITRGSYAELINTVALRIADTDTLENYFVTRFKYTKKQAEGATVFFTWLAREAGIELSPKLKNMVKSPQSKSGKETDGVATKEPKRSAGKKSAKVGIEDDFAHVDSDDFTFKVRKDLHSMDFAHAQVIALLDYWTRKLKERNPDENP
jgi:hypothetical protein